MKLADLKFAPSFDLPAPSVLYRIQRARARRGSLRVGRILLPPSHLLSGRFDVAGVPVGYFAEAPETAVYESLCRREATAVSMQAAAIRTLLCVQTTQPLRLLDLRMHASSWPVLQSLRLNHTQELAAEEGPASEFVEFLSLVGLGMDGLPKVRLVDVAHQEDGPYDAAQFPEGEIQLVLPAGTAEAPQQGRGRDQAGLDRNDHSQHVFTVPLDQVPIDGAA
jgi:hypothetical protein